MSYAIIFSSRTGNTRQLAETIQAQLPSEDCVYFGTPDDAALRADRLYIGFWTDKGGCDGDTAAFLRKVTNQEVYLFGTAGFGESQAYFDQVLQRAAGNLGADARQVGSFMCQGKMPMSVRQRYEKMLADPARAAQIQGLIANFDKALSHPDAADLEHLKEALHTVI